MTLNVTQATAVLIKRMLREYANRLGNDGGNDYEIEDTADNRRLLARMYEDYELRDELRGPRGKLMTRNDMLAGWLARQIETD